ncbi:glycine-rich domain-containing protein [Lentzea sp. NPDC058436]|uniref:glycine-rich domain-containing protein n=1 Tax=Lentzea sp. NPDC058436 TaxID=3346499 RepID=UPI0036675E13
MSATTCAPSAVATEVRHRLRLQLTSEHSMTVIEADRIITDTISFLLVCAADPHSRFRPSRQVDLGWHQFILNTRDYADFCDRVAGRFIHHVPDEFDAPVGRATEDVLSPTVNAIKAAGLPFHADLWLGDDGRCSQCHAGCTDCGQGDGN